MSASPSPSTSSHSTRSKRSRTQASLDSEPEYEEEIVTSRKRKSVAAPSATATTVVTAGNANNKKAERMERNRQAAQASRDRRKHYTEELELKVQQLEAQLATSSSPLASGSTDQVRLAELELENATLRQQLATSQEQGAQVQARMESFEWKLEWLTQVMYNNQQPPSQPQESVSPLDLQQTIPSPILSSSNLSLDPQTLLSLLPPSTACSESAITSSGQVEENKSISLLARERFLPRISTCSLPPQPLQTIVPSRQALLLDNKKKKRPLRHSLGNSLSNRNTNLLIKRNGIQPHPNSKNSNRMGSGLTGSQDRDMDIKKKTFLRLRFLSEKK